MDRTFITWLIGSGALIAAIAAAISVDTEDDHPFNDDSPRSGNTRSVSATPARWTNESGKQRPPAKTKSAGKDQSLITKLHRDGSVVVGGDVRNPGPLSMTLKMTLSSAIERAGGATEFGSLKRVKITRDGEQRSYDTTDPKLKNIPLQANDCIEVPRKSIFAS